MMRLSLLAASYLAVLALNSLDTYATAEAIDEASQCLADTTTLYESGNGALIEAAINFNLHMETLCLSPESSTSETNPCKMPDVSILLEILSTEGVKLEASLDFTETYSDATFITYKDSCLNAGGKMCYVDANADVSGSYYSTPYQASVSIDGYPLCSAQICDKADMTDIANAAVTTSANYYDILGDVTLEITHFICDVGETEANRALRGAV